MKLVKGDNRLFNTTNVVLQINDNQLKVYAIVLYINKVLLFSAPKNKR